MAALASTTGEGMKLRGRRGPAAEWTLNGMDYEHLREEVRRATTYADGRDETDGRVLGRLLGAFRAELSNVNLFVSLKMREITARLETVEAGIVEWRRRKVGEPGARALRLRRANGQLAQCSADLQRLARYLLQQKAALRKLTRRFVRYYPYDEADAEGFVAALYACEELQQGHEGVVFTGVDLEPYLLEVSLIVGVLYDLEMKHRNMERAREPLNNVLGRPITSCLTFDTLFLGKYHPLQRFLISQDNVGELKFLLMKLDYQMIDDDVLSTSRQLANIALPGDEHMQGSCRAQSLRLFDLAAARPTRVRRNNSLPDRLRTLSQLRTHLYPLDEQFMTDEAYNQHPNIFVRGQQEDACVLMCHVGGMRNHIITQNLPLTLALDCLTKRQWSHKNVPLSALDKLCLDWVHTNNLGLSDFVISVKRTRFFTKRDEVISGTTYTSVYLITLDEEVFINNTLKLPHAFVEVRKLTNTVVTSNKSTNKIDTALSHLIDVMLDMSLSCYPLAPSDTLWKMAYELKDTPAEDVERSMYAVLAAGDFQDSSNISRETLFAIGRRRLDQMSTPVVPLRTPSLAKSSHKSQDAGSLSSSGEPPQRKRYWNELDEQEDAEAQDCFYRDAEELHTGDYEAEHGFIKFDKNFILNFYQYIHKLNGIFCYQKKPPKEYAAVPCSGDSEVTRSELTPLIPQNSETRSYSALEVQSTLPGGGSQLQVAEWDDEAELVCYDELDALYGYKHDEVVSLFYLTTLLVSCITTGTTVGIMFSLFSDLGNDQTEFEGSNYIAALILVSLVVSLMLSSFSLLLLFSRYHMAPWWHYSSCIVVFILVTLCVCYGVVKVFI
ncbi:AaceriAGR160Wp [[Ashbya] aceris (nom. inval.)]|nr:AaceriAGR160Wp [[Ashbya] aceris (nom. inval.)]